jgi:diguanylate cyclase (GGDEF)-like protein/PAS domain S-box-containing protein
MLRHRHLASLWLGLGYAALAAPAVAMTRFDGGVAFIWPAAALLIAALMAWPRRRWPDALAACGVASFLVTGMLGLGWAMALPFVVVNLVEAVVAATLLRPARRGEALGSADWLFKFILAGGVAGPIAGAVLATLFGLAIGLPPVPTLIGIFTGHALGNLTFIPLMMVIVDRQAANSIRLPPGRTAGEAVGLLGLVTVTTLAAFWQRSMPLLFLPLMPVILATFRLGRMGAAIAIVIVALVGGGLTIAGRGPVYLFHGEMGVRMQFLQFYLATIVLTVLPVAADLKRRAELHRKLRESEGRYRMLADHSTDILMQCAVGGTLTYVSPAIRQLGGYDPDALIGKPASDLIATEDWPVVEAAHAAMMADPSQPRSFEYRAVMADGELRWFESSARAVVDGGGRPFATLSVIRDIAARKAMELRLTQAALTDPLTGLPNRRAFREAAGRLLADQSGEPACIAMFDLDHFKQINDVHGHDGGDAVLRQFAVQGHALLRERDMLARLGGEEFALLLPGAKVEDALQVCERLRRSVAEMGVPSRTGMIRITVSGGVAMLGETGIDAALKSADLALYQAKAGGRDQLALAA